VKEAQVYLDCAAAMPPDAGVLTYYSAMLKEFYVNQEAIHLLAYRGRQALADAGRRVSKVLTGDENHPVIWGGSATELFRLLADAPFFRSAVSSVLEHPAVAANLGRLPEFTQWHADKNGAIVPQKLAKIPDLALFHQVQSELGVIQNLDALFELLPGACRAVDAVQAAGKLEIYPGADIWIISGAKFGAPGGAAALLKAGGRFTDLLLEHARKYRHDQYAAGRIPVPQALALAAALETCESRRQSELLRLAQLHRLIVERCAALGIVPTVEPEEFSPYILNLMLPQQQSAIVVRALSERGVFAASGSACSAESDTPSAALLAIGKSKNAAYRSLRLSFGAATTAEDVEIFLFELENVLKNY